MFSWRNKKNISIFLDEKSALSVAMVAFCIDHENGIEYFLEKIRKIFQNVMLKFLPSMLSVNDRQMR